MAKNTVYIDGESGTTGLEIRALLQTRSDINLVAIDPAKRKDPLERKKLLNSCDIAFLCLPDDAAREAVAMIDNPAVRVIDASTAYRTAPGWVYGFPEMTRDQADAIRKATRVSNPGCYPTGFIALIRPLIDNGIIPENYGITVNAISGYSGGGKELIALCELPEKTERADAFCLYGIEQTHKHLPEMRLHTGLRRDPIFLPAYSGAFFRGMLVTVALRLDDLNAQTGKSCDAEAVHAALSSRYEGQKNVWVEPLQAGPLEKAYVLTPSTQNNTNHLQLRVFANREKSTVILTACLDNLGKGASGAALQNLDLMLSR